MASLVDFLRHALASRPIACATAGLCGAALIAAAAWAQPSAVPAAAASAAVPPAAVVPVVPRAAVSPNAAWAALTPAQRATLKPLEREWGAINGNRRQKWLEVAERLPRMSADDRARVQARMVEWATMTPQQRAQVRLQFQEAKQVAPQNRKESWDAYQALPPDERSRLAVRAAGEANPAASAVTADTRRGARAERGTPQVKSNIVATPGPAPAPRAVAPTIVQAQTGATTTLMSRRPAPPSHQQVGLPKIAATPEFVDSATLLPQRGAQGAGVRVAPAASAVSAASAPVIRR